MCYNENSPLVMARPIPALKRGVLRARRWGRVFGIKNRRTEVRGFRPAPIFDEICRTKKEGLKKVVYLLAPSADTPVALTMLPLVAGIVDSLF